MKTIKCTSHVVRLVSTLLLVLIVVSMVGASALAVGNVEDQPFGFYISASGYTPMQSQDARDKRDSTALYVYFDKGTTYGVKIQALGATTQYGTYSNYTRANGRQVDYVTCYRKIDYSIHSLINESNCGWAKLSFWTKYSTSEYISGEWSPDTMNSHTDAT